MLRTMFSGKIFRSRWAALLWAVGIVWTAYDVAEANSPPADQGKAQVNQTQSCDSEAAAQDTALLQQFVGGK
jgi:hypothetical protein